MQNYAHRVYSTGNIVSGVVHSALSSVPDQRSFVAGNRPVANQGNPIVANDNGATHVYQPQVGAGYQPPQLNGDGKADVEMFLDRYEMYASGRGWSEYQKMGNLYFALTHRAADVLSRNKHLSYTDFIEVLRANFGNENRKQQFLACLLYTSDAADE